MKRTLFSTKLLLRVLVFLFVALVIITEGPLRRNRSEKTRQIDEATEFLCSHILLTRQKAAASGMRYRIHYDYATGACTTMREVAPGAWVPDNGKEEKIPGRVIMSPTSTPANGHIQIGTNGAIESGGAAVVIRLSDDEGGQRSIRISPAGMVQEIPTW
jgi:hypothetical protein